METTEKNYSRQLDKFIESKIYANSSYRETDSRTCVTYYQDKEGMIHSSTFNYSIIGPNPVTVDEFRQRMVKDPETTVSFYEN